MSGERFCVDCAYFMPSKEGEIYMPANLYMPANRLEDGLCALDSCVEIKRYLVAASQAEREPCLSARGPYGNCGPRGAYWKRRTSDGSDSEAAP